MLYLGANKAILCFSTVYVIDIMLRILLLYNHQSKQAAFGKVDQGFGARDPITGEKMFQGPLYNYNSD